MSSSLSSMELPSVDVSSSSSSFDEHSGRGRDGSRLFDLLLRPYRSIILPVFSFISYILGCCGLLDLLRMHLSSVLAKYHAWRKSSKFGRYFHKIVKYVAQKFPIFGTILRYKKGDIVSDVIAGLTVGVMLIPQSMAYAVVAELPLEYGLYGSTIPLLVYPVFGTSRQLALGPTAIRSIQTASTCSRLYDPEDETSQYVNAALTLTLLTGIIQVVLGLVKFGFVVNFLSGPTIAGFTTAAGCIIATSQLRSLFGVDFPRQSEFYNTLYQFALNIGDTHWPTLAFGAFCITFLLWNKYLVNRRMMSWVNGKTPCSIALRSPGAIMLVVLGIVVSYATDMEGNGFAIIGRVPSGFPPPNVPSFVGKDIISLLLGALSLALVGFVESVGIASVIAETQGYDLHPSQELIALGAADVAGGFFSSLPISGSFSRTAVNDSAGAKSVFAGGITAITVIACLLFFTQVIYYLPRAVLAAIVMASVVGLIGIKTAIHLWRIKKQDFLYMLAAFLFTLVLGIELGVLMAVAVSFALVIYKSSKPHHAELGLLPGSPGTYRDVKRFPEVETEDSVYICRFDASLYFANCAYVKKVLLKTPKKQARHGRKIRTIVFDMSATNYIDSSGLKMLQETHHVLLETHGVYLIFACVKGPVRDVMRRGGFIRKVGPMSFFWQAHEAVDFAKQVLVMEPREMDSSDDGFGPLDEYLTDYECEEDTTYTPLIFGSHPEVKQRNKIIKRIKRIRSSGRKPPSRYAPILASKASVTTLDEYEDEESDGAKPSKSLHRRATERIKETSSRVMSRIHTTDVERGDLPRCSSSDDMVEMDGLNSLASSSSSSSSS